MGPRCTLVRCCAVTADQPAETMSPVFTASNGMFAKHCMPNLLQIEGPIWSKRWQLSITWSQQSSSHSDRKGMLDVLSKGWTPHSRTARYALLLGANATAHFADNHCCLMKKKQCCRTPWQSSTQRCAPVGRKRVPS